MITDNKTPMPVTQPNASPALRKSAEANPDKFRSTLLATISDFRKKKGNGMVMLPASHMLKLWDELVELRQLSTKPIQIEVHYDESAEKFARNSQK